MKTIGVLIRRPNGNSLPAPSSMFLSAMAPVLRGWGLELLFVEPPALQVERDALIGVGLSTTDGETWFEARRRLSAVYNRFPSAGRPASFAHAVAALTRVGIPWGNGPVLNSLCTDKRRTGDRFDGAGLPHPETVHTPGEAFQRLFQWGALFAKPRYGSLGEGVYRIELLGGSVRVEPSAGPASGTSMVLDWGRPSEAGVIRFLESQHAREDYLYQRAVEPPGAGLRGCSIRSLVQRDHSGGWSVTGRVARVSTTDPVANVARGSRVWTVGELCQRLDWDAKSLEMRLDELDFGAIAALTSTPEPGRAAALELGLDYALDPQQRPFLLEANGKPLGRFGELARRGLGTDLQRQAELAPIARLDAQSPPAALDFTAIQRMWARSSPDVARARLC